MVEFIQIKNKKGLTQSRTHDIQKPIAETKGVSNAVTVQDNDDIKVNVIKQSSLTSDCWMVQMQGFDACVDCQFYAFNPKSGQLRKKSECGGGQTLALMIKNIANMSIWDQDRAGRFFQANPEASFVKFALAMDKERAWTHPLRKYRMKIKDLTEIEKTEQVFGHHRSLDVDFPYQQTLTDTYSPKPTFKRTHAENSHKPWQCTCVVPEGRKTTPRDETFVDNIAHITIYYYHQHCIVFEQKFKDCTEYVLDSCGFHTSTTKDRLNNYLPQGYSLSQQNHKWLLSTPHGTIDFYDGMRVHVE